MDSAEKTSMIRFSRPGMAREPGKEEEKREQTCMHIHSSHHAGRVRACGVPGGRGGADR